MSNAMPRPWTVEDFFAWEAQQEEKYEFLDGVIFMMVGGSNAHTIIKGNAFMALHNRLGDGPCRALVEGPKVVTARQVLYPDVLVVCGGLELEEDRVHRPSVIVEVLSQSTANRDRGMKWMAYQQIEPLQHYLMIDQGQRRVELYTRRNQGWLFQPIEPPQSVVPLTGIEIELPLDELYRGTGV